MFAVKSKEDLAIYAYMIPALVLGGAAVYTYSKRDSTTRLTREFTGGWLEGNAPWFTQAVLVFSFLSWNFYKAPQ